MKRFRGPAENGSRFLHTFEIPWDSSSRMLLIAFGGETPVIEFLAMKLLIFGPSSTQRRAR